MEAVISISEEAKKLRTSPIVNSVQKSPNKTAHSAVNMNPPSLASDPVSLKNKVIVAVPPMLTKNCSMIDSDVMCPPHLDAISKDNNSGAISDEDTLDRLKKTAENIVADVTKEVRCLIVVVDIIYFVLYCLVTYEM